VPAVTNHRVTIYRRVPVTTPDRARLTRWQRVAVNVPCDIQPASGSVQQEPYGRRATRRVRAFFASGTDLQPDDGLEVTAGIGPRRWLVADAGDWGPPGDLEADLVETDERFDE
jgi:hypothetical protein